MATVAVAGNKIYCTGTGYTTTSTITFSQGGTPSGRADALRVIGYSTTRGDNGQFVLTLQTNTGLTGLLASGSVYLENCNVNCSSLGTSTGMSATGNYVKIVNCKVSNFTSKGIIYSELPRLESSPVRSLEEHLPRRAGSTPPPLGRSAQ